MKKIHYAWVVCLGCSLMLLACVGVISNVFSATQPYIISENGFTNAQVSAITTVRAVTYLISMVIALPFFRRLSFRLGCTVCTLFGMLAYVMFAFSKSLPMYYAAGAVAGLSYGLGSMIPASILIKRWFYKKTGLALGLCTASTGLAAVVFSPILTDLIERNGLRSAFLTAALICAVCAVLVFALVRDDPDGCGLQPLGGSREESAGADNRPEPHFSKLHYLLIVFVVGLLNAIIGAGMSHQIVLFNTAGQDPIAAALAYSVCGLCLMAGKCVYGILYDRFGSVLTNFLFLGLLIVSSGMCALAEGCSTVWMFTASVFWGLGTAASTVGVSVWASDFSTRRSFAARQRAFQISGGVCLLPMSLLPGVVADLTGSYAPTYLIFGTIFAAGLAVLQLTYRSLSKQSNSVS